MKYVPVHQSWWMIKLLPMTRITASNFCWDYYISKQYCLLVFTSGLMKNNFNFRYTDQHHNRLGKHRVHGCTRCFNFLSVGPVWCIQSIVLTEKDDFTVTMWYYFNVFHVPSVPFAFSALMLLVEQQEGHPACKKLTGRMLACIWPSWSHCHSLSLAAVNSDRFYLSDAGSPG